MLFTVERYNMAFKIVRTESRLVRGLLTNHGFHEVTFCAKSCTFKRFTYILQKLKLCVFAAHSDIPLGCVA